MTLHTGHNLPTDDPEASKESVRGAITEVGGGQTETDELEQLIKAIWSDGYTQCHQGRSVDFNKNPKAQLTKERALESLRHYSHRQTEQVLERLASQAQEYEVTDLERMEYHQNTPLKAIPSRAIQTELARLRTQGGSDGE